jgi:hypothetical protein
MENFQIIENYDEHKKETIINFLETKYELPNQLTGSSNLLLILLHYFICIYILAIFPLCLQVMTYKVNSQDQIDE